MGYWLGRVGRIVLAIALVLLVAHNPWLDEDDPVVEMIGAIAEMHAIYHGKAKKSHTGVENG